MLHFVSSLLQTAAHLVFVLVTNDTSVEICPPVFVLNVGTHINVV